MNTDYQLIIVGSGVTGTALAFLLAQYSKLDNIAILDKYASVAAVNSDAKYNSQTLHCGDIESNYDLSKAQQVCKAADLVRQYALKQPDAEKIIYANSKMLLAVGDAEIEKIKQRHQLFKPHFAYMQWLDSQQIADLEPNVGKNRKEEIAAMAVDKDYCALDFGNLARSFIANAQSTKKRIDLLLNHRVHSTKRVSTGYQLMVKTADGEQIFNAKFVLFAAGAYSLTYAKSMGYGEHYGLLSVAGSFYFSAEALNGKVYTLQNDKLPFAAVHGDVDVNISGQTRFGPTALILPQLERYRHDTYWDYFKVLDLDKAVFKALWKLLKEKDIRHYIGRNFAYEMPYIGRGLFAQQVQKIIPSINAKNLKPAKGFGGLRPQIIDKNQAQLVLGEAQITTDEGLIFNITPSPGASTCLYNGLKDALKICAYLGVEFDQIGFERYLGISTLKK